MIHTALKSSSIPVFILAGWLALVAVASPAAAASAEAPEPDAAQREVLETQARIEALVDRLRKEKKLTLPELMDRLRPRRAGPAGTELTAPPSETLLKAVIRVRNLDTRRYKTAKRGGSGFDLPENVATATDKVYNIDLFNALLNQPRGTPAQDATGKTALMYAAEANQFEVLRTLLLLPKVDPGPTIALGLTFWREPSPFQPLYPDKDEKRRDYLDWCDQYGYTALMHACANGSVDAVHYLLKAGASTKTRCEVARFDAATLARINGNQSIQDALEANKDWYTRGVESGDFGTYLLMSFILGGATLPALLRGITRFAKLFRSALEEEKSRGKPVRKGKAR